MIELPVLELDGFKFKRGNYGLAVIDEKTISCQNLGTLAQKISEIGNVILMMHDEQFKMGLRGWAKAQILNSVVRLDGVIPATAEDLVLETKAPWKTVYIPEPLTAETRHVMVRGNEQPVTLEFPVSDNPNDAELMGKAWQLVETSNCWLDPAACVFVKDEQVVCEGVSTRMHSQNCKGIPLNMGDLKLNPGERMLFCDSQHAERMGVANAARQGVSLKGTRAVMTKFPCRPCMQSLIGAGVTEVVFDVGSYGYKDAPLLLENGIKIKQVRKEE